MHQTLVKPAQKIRVSTHDFGFFHGDREVVRGINLNMSDKSVTAIIGPSGCGKSTILRAMNRIYETKQGGRPVGEIRLDGENILDKNVDVTILRKRMGMVFQKATPFPKSIFDNVAYGIKIWSNPSRSELEARVEDALRRSALWDEAKDRLGSSALALSGGQQQRLCIARALAVDPDVLLMDEPCSSLDPIATAKIEDLITDLEKERPIIIVTHNMGQAFRVADMVAFICKVDPDNPERIATDEKIPGTLVEYGSTSTMQVRAERKLTEYYLAGRFG